ncbi:hypothetical protein AMTR_s00082p00079280 [Amborella trichopoda]|uniref:Uncharacterized protein n=1 Tax=Amborella trichopoda TaxID=13333 RepID=W1NPP1_AMBTC|nr:hypothetical protein AMTR_s00082p00079280 [Amborella trichopoda]
MGKRHKVAAWSRGRLEVIAWKHGSERWSRGSGVVTRQGGGGCAGARKTKVIAREHDCERWLCGSGVVVR